MYLDHLSIPLYLLSGLHVTNSSKLVEWIVKTQDPLIVDSIQAVHLVRALLWQATTFACMRVLGLKNCSDDLYSKP